jgi:hypothetical protein
MGHYERDRNYLDAERHFQVADLMASIAVAPAPKTPKYTFYVDSEETVVGRDPEYADMDNPRGEIYAVRYFMVAATEAGRLYRWAWERTEAKAEQVFQLFAPAVEEWPLWRCMYGSEAYEQDDCERDTIRWELEDALGPDYQHHPHFTAAMAMSL